MPIEVQCGECGTQFRVKDEMAGRRVKCKGCGSPVRVEQEPDEPLPTSRAKKGSGKRKKASNSGTYLPILLSAGAVLALVVIGLVALRGRAAPNQAVNPQAAPGTVAAGDAVAKPSGDSTTPATGPAAPPTASPASATNFRSPFGGLAANFPGSPKAQIYETNSELGEYAHFQRPSDPQKGFGLKNTTYVVVRLIHDHFKLYESDLTKVPEDVECLISTNASLRILSRANTTVGKIPAVEIAMQEAQGVHQEKSIFRALVHGNVLCYILVRGSQAEVDDSQTKSFLDSLQVDAEWINAKSEPYRKEIRNRLVSGKGLKDVDPANPFSSPDAPPAAKKGQYVSGAGVDPFRKKVPAIPLIGGKADDGWIPVESRFGGLSFKMPGVPPFDPAKPGGLGDETYLYTDAAKGRNYFVRRIYDKSFDAFEADVVKHADQFIKTYLSQQGKVLKRTDVAITNRLSGMEIEFADTRGVESVRKLCACDAAVVEMAVLGPGVNLSDPEVVQFFQSLHVEDSWTAYRASLLPIPVPK